MVRDALAVAPPITSRSTALQSSDITWRRKQVQQNVKEILRAREKSPPHGAPPVVPLKGLRRRDVALDGPLRPAGAGLRETLRESAAPGKDVEAAQRPRGLLLLGGRGGGRRRRPPLTRFEDLLDPVGQRGEALFRAVGAGEEKPADKKIFPKLHRKSSTIKLFYLLFAPALHSSGDPPGTRARGRRSTLPLRQRASAPAFSLDQNT